MKQKTRTTTNCASALASAATFAIVANVASAQPAFVKVGPETTYDAGERCGVPHWAVADFDGDGRLDFVLGNTPWSSFTPPSNTGALMLWIAQPDGSYREQTTRLFSGPITSPYTFSDVRVADFNADGIPDVYIPDYGPDNSGPVRESTPKLALSTPAGFVDASAQFAGLTPRLIHTGAIADIDGNGTVDIYVGSNTGAPVPGKKPYLLLNDGRGNFTFDQSRLPAVVLAQIPEQGARSKQIDASTWQIADERFTGSLFADVNRDGFPDLILLPPSTNPAGLVLLNDGRGDFSKMPHIELPPGYYGGNWLVGRKDGRGNWDWVSSMQPAPGPGTIQLEGRAVDLNGDGYPDLVIAQTMCQKTPTSICYSGGRLQILINQGGRGFVDETAARGSPGFDSGSNNYQGTLQVVDVNGDGFPDLVAPYLWPYASHAYLNDGTGKFTRATLPGIPTDGLHVVVSGGFQQPTRIANVRFDWRFNTPRAGMNECTLRVQAWERPAPVPATPNYQGLWWAAPAGAESGWGINFAHQGDTVFASWFTYDTAGRGWWLVATTKKTDADTYTGTLYQTRGPAFNAVPFDPNAVTATAAGTATLKFTGADSGSFTYTVDATTQTKSITKQLFGPAPTCSHGASPGLLALATNYQDLWWAAPANSESGWGVNLTHQGDKIFATWFSYDTDGTPLWLVATAAKQPTGVYRGVLYRTTGPAFSAVPFNPVAVTSTVVGELVLTFAHGNAATFAYTVNGVSQSKTITRQLFSSAGTYCQ